MYVHQSAISVVKIIRPVASPDVVAFKDILRNHRTIPLWQLSNGLPNPSKSRWNIPFILDVVDPGESLSIV